MRAYCQVSFAIKLALFCLAMGVVAGLWLGLSAVPKPGSLPAPPPVTAGQGS